LELGGGVLTSVVVVVARECHMMDEFCARQILGYSGREHRKATAGC